MERGLMINQRMMINQRVMINQRIVMKHRKVINQRIIIIIKGRIRREFPQTANKRKVTFLHLPPHGPTVDGSLLFFIKTAKLPPSRSSLTWPFGLSRMMSLRTSAGDHLLYFSQGSFFLGGGGGFFFSFLVVWHGFGGGFLQGPCNFFTLSCVFFLLSPLKVKIADASGANRLYLNFFAIWENASGDCFVASHLFQVAEHPDARGSPPRRRLVQIQAVPRRLLDGLLETLREIYGPLGVHPVVSVGPKVGAGRVVLLLGHLEVGIVLRLPGAEPALRRLHLEIFVAGLAVAGVGGLLFDAVLVLNSRAALDAFGGNASRGDHLGAGLLAALQLLALFRIRPHRAVEPVLEFEGGWEFLGVLRFRHDLLDLLPAAGLGFRLLRGRLSPPRPAAERRLVVAPSI